MLKYTPNRRMKSVDCLTLSDYLCKKTVKKRKRQAIYAAFNHRCAYCGNKAESLDHVTPKSKGGSELVSNLVPSCLRCNGLKGHTDVWEFFESQNFYCSKRALMLEIWINKESFNNFLPLSRSELPPEYFKEEPTKKE